MKKTLVAVLMLIFAMSMTFAAVAEDSDCPHTNISENYSGVEYYPWSAGSHELYYQIDYQCDDCNAWLEGKSVVISGVAPHEFDGDECMECGYVRTNIPKPEELQRRAHQRITADPNDLIAKTATVLHSGNIRAEADENSAIVGSAAPTNEFEIVSYVISDTQSVWLEIRYGTGTAWISASLVEISGANTAKGDEDIYIGRGCRVKVSSGRGRTAPGKNNTVIDYVSYREFYEILDAQYANDNTLWFKIRTTSGTCWISSGLVDVY